MSAQSMNEWLKHLESYKDEDGQHYDSPQDENVTTQQQFEWLMERGKIDPQMKYAAISAVAGGFVTENPTRIASRLIDAWLSEERSIKPWLRDERRSSVLSELAELYGAAIAMVCNKNQAKFLVNAYKAGKLSAASLRSQQILDVLERRGFVKLTTSESVIYCGYPMGLDVEITS